MTGELCGIIHKLCSHVDIKCGLPKDHDGAHRTLIQFLGGKSSKTKVTGGQP